MINIVLKKPTITRIKNEDSFHEVYMKRVYSRRLEEEASSKKKQEEASRKVTILLRNSNNISVTIVHTNIDDHNQDVATRLHLI
jgi:hypothetical protein